MDKIPVIFLMLAAALLPFSMTFSADIQYIEGKPLTETVKEKAASYDGRGAIELPLITWGGDVATILAEEKDLFKSEGVEVELIVENNFPKQVKDCLTGKTPYLRGTMGMINSAAEVFKREGLDLVVVYQLTWSVGGDCMVARKNKTLKNIKDVALQLYGPHMDYAANLFQTAGRLDKVKFKWLSELTLPTKDTGGKIIDPVSAFQSDDGLDAVMCIIPDGLLLTSGGKGGTGAEGSVKGANIILSTKTADRIIADVYAVRSDYFSKNREEVAKVVRGLLKGQQELLELKEDKTQQAEFRKILARSADLLLGAPQAVGDVEALLADCEYVGYDGNIQFFEGKGTTRTLEKMTEEIQDSFRSLGLLSGTVALKSAKWDYDSLGSGLKRASVPSKTKPKFDPRKAQAKVEKDITVEPESWEAEGTLFMIEINFEPNQSVFSSEKYADDYMKAIEIAQTYGGALIVIEGHSDPLGILKARQEGKPTAEISEMEQAAKNLSLQRSQAVRKSFLEYAEKQGLRLDESQFVSVGMGISAPKYNPPRTKEEWAANRRVVFRIKQVEAEMTEFVPL